ncbi:hypothetical protein [Planktothricoides raciborskii]|uniref:Uncharacterized protein n=1 Tax=Planktothricoides raciborskii FACHB-1370 TaxID=2949576 RepID=A0ABR8EB47_9CYAN|nr:hypothetical protein [Planktothricoides raciborskii]MBD2543389.1 hypothetical protein [Planktothricoides raciborskii FACHB-1370]MBD2581688.1 hypothetical protein [Planktothricoides raciborskii FACHB-1261]
MMDRDNNIQEPIFSIDIEEKFDSVKDVNRFIKYCFIYDPLVDLNTGKKQHLFINPDRLPGHYFDSKLDKTKQKFILFNLMQIPSLTKLTEQYIESNNCNRESFLEKASNTVTYYTCLAPYRILNPQEITAKYLDDYCDKGMRWKKINSDKFETSQLLYYKQYICCEHEGEKGWIILSRSPKINIDDFHKTIGIGKNIVEADLNFLSKKGNLFLINLDSNRRIFDSDMPVNIEQMKNECQKYDPNIKIESFQHKYINFCDHDNIKFEFSCESEKYKFTASVYPSYIQWTVKTYIQADFDIPIKATGTTLKQAFEELIEKHNRLSSDSEFIREQVKYINEQIEKEQTQEAYDEYKWIISEFGSDIFPD